MPISPKRPPKNKKEAQADVLSTMGEDAPNVKPEKEEPAYQQLGEARILVSKALGKTIEKRKCAALVAYEYVHKAWQEAYRYYNHNQVKDDGGDNSVRGRSPQTFRQGDGFENIVFANTSTMVPAIYAKNPDVSFTTQQDEDREFVSVLSKAVNAIFKRKTHPGINLKPRMKKAALHAELTNFGVLKLEYISKDDSREEAENQMQELYAKFKEAKDIKEVKEIEGQMQAIEAKMEFMELSGFKLTNLIPTMVIPDPMAENEDGSDSNWFLEETYLPTDYLNARFTKKDDKKSDERNLIYKPTHRVKTESHGSREDMLGLVLETIESGDQSIKAHTDEQRQSYLYQNMTKCWWYWDRVTRRIYLWADNDWTWPIWVWEDDIKTSRFFPYFILQFIPSTGGIVSPGEVSYYLDQQDEINRINKEIIRIRKLVFSLLIYNKNKIDSDDAAKLINMLKGEGNENAIGIDLPEGMTMKDALDTLSPPSIQYKEVFDKGPIYSAVDKLSSVNDAVRGAQFKTNTVKAAVETYRDSAKVRIGNKTDAIEDTVADIAWTIAEILVSKVDPETIRGLVGDSAMKSWKGMSIEELNATCEVEVAAGSSEKPTASYKKEESIKVGQVLGQFGKAAPASTMKIILKLFSKSFPELDITEQDFADILKEATMIAQQGQTNPGAGSEDENGDIGNKLMSAPPEEKARVLAEVKAGKSPQEALKPLIERAQNAKAN